MKKAAMLILAGLVVGLGSGSLAVHYAVRNRISPHYSFLPEELNTPGVLADTRMREWTRYIHAGKSNEFQFKNGIVVYPVSVECSLVLEGVFMNVGIGIRPATEETVATWEQMPLSDRAKAYEFVCKALVNDFSQALRVDRDKVFLHFLAAGAYPRPDPISLKTQEQGSFKGSKLMMMTIERGQLLEREVPKSQLD